MILEKELSALAGLFIYDRHCPRNNISPFLTRAHMDVRGDFSLETAYRQADLD